MTIHLHFYQGRFQMVQHSFFQGEAAGEKIHSRDLLQIETRRGRCLQEGEKASSRGRLTQPCSCVSTALEEAGLCPKGPQRSESPKKVVSRGDCANKHASSSGPGYDGHRGKSGTSLPLSAPPTAPYESFWGYKKDRKQRASSWPLVK